MFSGNFSRVRADALNPLYSLVSFVFIHNSNNNAGKFVEISAAVQVLKSNRDSTAHSNDPSTCFIDIHNAIDRLFPIQSTLARKASKAHEVLVKARFFILKRNGYVFIA